MILWRGQQCQLLADPALLVEEMTIGHSEDDVLLSSAHLNDYLFRYETNGEISEQLSEFYDKLIRRIRFGDLIRNLFRYSFILIIPSKNMTHTYYSRYLLPVRLIVIQQPGTHVYIQSSMYTSNPTRAILFYIKSKECLRSSYLVV